MIKAEDPIVRHVAGGVGAPADHERFAAPDGRRPRVGIVAAESEQTVAGLHHRADTGNVARQSLRCRAVVVEDGIGIERDGPRVASTAQFSRSLNTSVRSVPVSGKHPTNRQVSRSDVVAFDQSDGTGEAVVAMEIHIALRPRLGGKANIERQRVHPGIGDSLDEGH